MGKPNGFLEVDRELPLKRRPIDRKMDFKEYVLPYPKKDLNQQASRCMDCGVPFCQSGCPLGNIIPEFNDAVYHQDWQEAYEILRSTNNFPEFTGRICPAPCEAACVLGINQKPVAIEEIEKHIIEKAFESGFVKAKRPLQQSGKRVAIIGSGPAGLAAADQLNQAGHQVLVFERDEKPGGLLRYGIPDFKLEKWVLDRRLELLEGEGIQFQCSVEVGKTKPLSELSRNFDAVLLAGGSTIPRDLPVPNRDLKGIHFAMPYLKQQNRRVDHLSALSHLPFESNCIVEEIWAEGKHVVVIGGGDTGSDCIGTANRQKASSITQLEVLPQPPADRTPGMPWPQYPFLLKTTSSHEEGVERKWSVETLAFVGNDLGMVTGLHLREVLWKTDETGKYLGYDPVPDSDFILEADLVLLAMGFIRPETSDLTKSMEHLELDDRGNIKASERNYQTRESKIFCAGDMRRGQSLVVWAISEGREAAKAIDEFLMGSSILASKDAARLELKGA